MQKQRSKLINTIQGVCLATLALLALVFLLLQVTDNRQRFSLRAQKMRADYVEQQKEITKSEMERVLKTINYHRSRIEKQTREIIQQRVYEAHAIAQNIFAQNQGENSADIQQMIVDALRPIRFNQESGYFFIFRRSDGVNVLHAATPVVEGNARLHIQDANGQFVIRDIIALTDTKQEGFYEYLWTKPGEEGNKHKKITFFKKFAPYDWFISTGLYLEDVEAQVQSELLEQISAIRFGKNGYFFVSNWQGICFAHGAQPELVGRDLWESVDSKGTKTSQKLIALAQQEQGGYVEFWWKKPDTGQERPKIGYARGIHDWEWMIGTGVYIDDIEVGITQLEARLDQQLYQELRKTILLTCFILLLFLAVFRVINRRLLNDFSQFTTFFEQAAREDKEIDPELLRFAELHQMADNANRMLREKIEVKHDLQNEKDRYKALNEASFGGVIMHEQGLILDCNKSLSDITGFSSEELIGMDGLKLIAPDSLELVLQNIKSGYDQDYEVEGVRKDGTTYPLAVRGKTISYQGRDVRVIEFRDITERKQAEEALRESESNLRNILLNMPVAVALTNHQQEIIFRNKRFVQMFGYTEEDVPTINQWWLKAYPDEKLRQWAMKSWAEDVQKAIADGTDFGGMEAPVVCKDGTTRYAEVSGIPLGNMLLTAFVDVTERKRIEEERQNIEKLNTVGTLAGGLAHDFNNILAGLYGNISLAKTKLAAEHPAFRFIESAEKSVATATQLTNQLLTFAKGGAPVKEKLSLANLVEEVVHFNLSGSSVKPVISKTENLWLAKADQGQIQQVFGNLTINAKQSMPEGGHLYIAMENAELQKDEVMGLEAGKYIRITISDEGAGIAQDHLDRIFEPYFTTKQTGSGLGLATSYSIINRHGGHISVTSSLGKGTTFTLFLPAVAEQERPATELEVAPSAQKMSAKVLVMDDEEIIRNTLSAMLEELSLTVTTCIDGQQALDIYRQAAEAGEPFDLVILDLTIPGGIGGKETAQNLLNFDPQAKMIVSSGYAEDQIMADYEKYGFSGVVAKPYSFDKLTTILTKTLKG